MKTLIALLAASLFLPSPAPAPADVPEIPATQKITPFLWFDDDAEQAIALYRSVLPDTQVLSQARWGEGGPVPAGTLMSARIRIAGQELMLMNGGPTHRLSEAFSLMVTCETQAEVDELWSKLTADGGEPGQCGWLKDRYGLSWQIIPTMITTLCHEQDKSRAGRVFQAMMTMGKIEIAKLQAAYDGR
jgi:predicted 3-demethylubiquinone-9 3-methyltransferase (glyoxalase superfamily)